MRDIKDLTLKELEEILIGWNESRFHAKQIFSWIYKKGAADFEQMSNLSANLRKRLKEKFYIYGLSVERELISSDGTEKLLFKLRDGNYIEGVIIPAEARVTGCISSQAGCKFSCGFCASGLAGFKRNLLTGEILEQILYIRGRKTAAFGMRTERGRSVFRFGKPRAKACGASFSKTYAPDNKVTHIVFMGTGEPLDNYDNVLKAVKIINSEDAFNIGARRITLSTNGIINGIEKLAGEKLQIELSISLHAADDKTRSGLMPVNKKYPLKELIEACKDYIKKTDRQLTFEYVLIKGVNSALRDAQNLSKILKGLKLHKINLIPANPVRNIEILLKQNKVSSGANPIRKLKIEPPNKLDILLFRDYLLKQGMNVTLRKPRGVDISAACGQLKLKHENI